MRRDKRFELVIVAAQRCRQLMRGAKPRLKTASVKPTTIALEEVVAGQIELAEEEEDEADSADEKEAGEAS